MSAGTRMPRWAIALLVASLALNLGIVGLVVGYALRGPLPPVAWAPPADGMRAIHRALPDSEQRALRREILARRDDIRARREALAVARRDFLAAVRAEPFSAETMRDALERQATLWDDFGRETREALVRRIDAMPPDARAAFATRLEAAMTRRAPHQDAQPRGE